mgnify:CR=1 FL=1
MKLRGSLRSTGPAPISLFAFQDIVFAATGIFLFVAIMMTLFGKIDLIATEALDETEELREELRVLAEKMTIAKHQAEIVQSQPKDAFIQLSDTAIPADGQTDEAALAKLWLYDLPELFQFNRGLRKRADKLYQKLTSMLMVMNRRELRLELLQSGAYQVLEAGDLAIVQKGKAHDFREPIFLLIDSERFTITYPGRPELEQKFSTQESLKEHIQDTFNPRSQSFLILLKPSGIRYFEEAKNALRQMGYDIGYEPVIEDFAL